MYNNKYFKYNQKYNLFKNLYGGYTVGDRITNDHNDTFEIYKIEGKNFFLIINGDQMDDIFTEDDVNFIFQKESAEVIVSSLPGAADLPETIPPISVEMPFTPPPVLDHQIPAPVYQPLVSEHLSPVSEHQSPPQLLPVYMRPVSPPAHLSLPSPSAQLFPQKGLKKELIPPAQLFPQKGLKKELIPPAQLFPQKGLKKELIPPAQLFPQKGLKKELIPPAQLFPQKGLKKELIPPAQLFPQKVLKEELIPPAQLFPQKVLKEELSPTQSEQLEQLKNKGKSINQTYQKQYMLYIKNITNIIKKINKKRLYSDTIKNILINLYFKQANNKLKILENNESQSYYINECRKINYKIYLYYESFKLFTITKKKLRELSPDRINEIEIKIDIKIQKN
jgi:hypothetical protein